MTNYSLSLNNVQKVFGRRLIFKNINLTLTTGRVYGLSGRNGSGKSTLAKIIAGITSTTSGKIEHTLNGKEIKPEKLHDHLGFVSPYLVLYDEFTALENLEFFTKIRGNKFDKDNAEKLLEDFQLGDRGNDELRGYSSGMKQRMKFIFALMHSPQLLILDEPTSNLDEAGKSIVYSTIKNKLSDNLVIIASNESSDLALCDEIIEIEKYK
ncbi:MAG: ABC transporter ATP-binding protein [Ignavibacteriae bacterium]|nr:ABC transporter ATP-binding protein [Ignavibacteriota bacterium]NOG97250.1 ABC transporter ATP-binding protein [Ignavibacteriota bacterium]